MDTSFLVPVWDQNGSISSPRRSSATALIAPVRFDVNLSSLNAKRSGSDTEPLYPLLNLRMLFAAEYSYFSGDFMLKIFLGIFLD